MSAPDRNTWATPQSVVDAVSRFMGCDPWIDFCADAANAKAESWVGVNGGCVDGYACEGPLESVSPEIALSAPLNGWAWCNPPYSAEAILSVCRWLTRYVECGGTVVLLVNLDESTKWNRMIFPHVRARLVVSQRIQFVPPEGVEESSNLRCQSIYILGPKRPWDVSYLTFQLDWPSNQNLTLFEEP